MSGTRLCQLLAEWAEEDRAMSDLYDSISLEDAKEVIADLLTGPKVKGPADEAGNLEARQ